MKKNLAAVHLAIRPAEKAGAIQIIYGGKEWPRLVVVGGPDGKRQAKDVTRIEVE